MIDLPAGPSQGLYLHFLDRELNEAAGASIRSRDLAALLRLLATMVTAPLYCGLSAPWENDRLDPVTLREIEVLCANNALTFVSHSMSQSEFIDSRRNAYEHDQARYARYFTSTRELPWARPTMHKSRGSTGPLVQHLRNWAEDSQDYGRFTPTTLRVRAPTAEALRVREAQAVTWSFFEPHMGELATDARARATLRREISRGFTQDYLRFAGGSIATGITQLQAFDNLATVFPDFHVPLLRELAAICGLSEFLRPDDTDLEAWAQFVSWRDRDQFRLVGSVTAWIIRALWKAETQRVPGRAVDVEEFRSGPATVTRMIDALRRAVPYGARRPAPETYSPSEALTHAFLALEACAQKLGSADKTVQSFLESSRDTVMTTDVDVVVLVTTQVEYEAVRSRLSEEGGGPRPSSYAGASTYTSYGPIGGTHVALVRSSMGSMGPGGSSLTVIDAIRQLRPWAVLAVGIAFGVDESQNPIGQVLLSEQLVEYEPQRVGVKDGGTDIRPRGARMPGSAVLLSRFRDSQLDSLGIQVKSGQLLSGEKLIDNPELKTRLLEQYPDAIGGEMEGAGLFAAVAREGVHGLVVKAVCDYASNKAEAKTERQEAAAAAAADAFMHVLRSGGLRPPRT